MRDQAGDRAVLVDQQRHVVAVALHLAQQSIERLGVGHEHRRTHHLGHLGVPAAVAGVIGLLHKVFEIDDADDVVDVLADHRDAGMPTAHRQRRGLAGGLVAFDPHHLGARHHHLAGRGVAEFEHRLDHPALVVGDHTALLRQVDDLAQLDLGGERTVAKAAARGQRVAQQHQQPADAGSAAPKSLAAERPTPARWSRRAGGRGCAGPPRSRRS